MCREYMTPTPHPYVDEHEYNAVHVRNVRISDDQIDLPMIDAKVRLNFLKMVQEATAHAIREGIKANSIIINENMVKVDEFPFMTAFGDGRLAPKMICGLNVHLTKNELPEGYSFAVLEGPTDRLQQFESIGMEPDELRKAAELYRRIKEVME